MPSFASAIAPFTAPQLVCPITSTNFAPDNAQANSILPRMSSFATFPATRLLNKSPIPESKMISAGALESIQLKITAAGY